MKTLFSLIFIFAFFLNSYCYPQDTNSVSIKNKNLDVYIEKENNPVISIDGDLNEPQWKNTKKLSGWVEIDPRDNVTPNVETEAMMFYDDDNIYFGFICHEPDVNKIRKTFTERDKIFSDDFVGFFLDTYSESKQAYELFVNPFGIQGDLMWTSSGNNASEDETFDAIWYSAAKIYKDRWTVEVSIPFKSIRFPSKSVQDWRFHLLRIRPRQSREQISFVPIDRNQPTLFASYATLKGLKNIKGGKNLEILPYALGSQSGSITDESNADSKFQNEKLKGQFGFNLKYGITSNLTADFALNPDFSQVESDAAQLDVNNTFALFYSEKRPFFIEGKNMFQTPLQVVYTRSINNPLYAFKLTGKVGKNEIGFMSAYDKLTPFLIPSEESSDFYLSKRKSFSNILRFKHTIKDDSYLGFIYTDRQVRKDNDKFFDIDGYNRVFGIDGNIRFLENYSLTFQALKYITKEINDTNYSNSSTFNNGQYNSALDGESYSGYGGYLNFSRSAKYWNFYLEYSDASPQARRDNGYISNNNLRTVSLWQGYMFYPETKVFSRIQPTIYSYLRHDYDGRLKEEFFSPSVWVQLNNQINFTLQYFLVNNEVFNNVYHQGARRFTMNANINTFKHLTGGLYLSLGKYIVREDNPYIGWGYNIEVWNIFKPISRLVIENDCNYFELAKRYGGEKIYAGYILRNKATFQFSPSLSLRLITQYDSFNHIFNFDPLLSYKLNPFSIFYIGSTHNYSELQDQRGVPKYALTDRQFFMKFQYLWRL